MELFYFWIKELWFAPSDLESKAVVQEFKVVYIPYWLFEVDVICRYNCMLGIAYADKLLNPKKNLKEKSNIIHRLCPLHLLPRPLRILFFFRRREAD